MNNKTKSIFKNFYHILLSNFISMGTSVLAILIIPKFFGVKEYGQFQIYLLYSSYVGILHLGWIDGIYLKYGGKKYSELDKKQFFSQFYSYLIFEVLICVLIMIMVSLFIKTDKKIVFYYVILCALIRNLRDLLAFILQATNRIKEASNNLSISRLIYILLILLCLINKKFNFKYLILSDLISRFVSLNNLFFVCKDITINKPSYFKFDYKEIFSNITSGFQLLISNYVSLLNIGIIQFAIEKTWDIKTFGKVSLAFTMTNFIMVFINALGLSIFPELKMIEVENYSKIYIKARTILATILCGFLLFYFPMKEIIIRWLPDYVESIVYFSILFPIFIFEGHMKLLINTYMKALRKESLLLKINTFSFFISLILSYIIIILYKKLYLSILLVIVILVIRQIIAEKILSSILEIDIRKDVFIEIGLVLTFILLVNKLSGIVSFIVFLVIYLLYLLINRQKLSVVRKMIQF